jgi:hypothetical protein
MKSRRSIGVLGPPPKQDDGRRAEPQSRSMLWVASVVSAARTFVIAAGDDE